MSAPLTFVMDEHLRGRLLKAIRRHNAKGLWPLDVIQVGDPPDLPLRSPDSTILIWAEQNDRVVITHDQSTMPVHFAAHLAAGHHSPGVVILRSRGPGRAIQDLQILAYCSLPGEWFDRIDYYP